MAEKEKPIGSQDDFKHMTPFEREKAEALRRAAGVTSEADAADIAFRKEMADLEERKKKLDADRAAFQEEQRLAAEGKPTLADASPKKPKIFHLLCAKDADAKIRVVGMYSTREEMAEGIAAGIAAYSAAGLKFGTVEFDINIKVDQPPTPLK